MIQDRWGSLGARQYIYTGAAKETDRAERDKDSLSLWKGVVSLEPTHLLSSDVMLILEWDTCTLIVLFLYSCTPS